MKNQLLSRITALSSELLSLSKNHKAVYVTAESLTAGLIGASIVEMPGSSAYFDRGFITYSNEAKMELLGVNETTLAAFGAVSENTVIEMVQGALNHSSLANTGVAVSGIAGPDGGSVKKPVGTVWIAAMKKGEPPVTECCHFEGDREDVRLQTVIRALEFLKDLTIN